MKKALGIICSLYLMGANTTLANPIFAIESAVAAPGEQIRLNLVAHSEEEIRHTATVFLFFHSLTKDAPSLLPGGHQALKGLFISSDIFPLKGTGVITELHLDTPTDAPENSLYIVVPMFQEDPIDAQGRPTPFVVKYGYVLLRSKPFFKGDLTDDGEADVADATKSLRLSLGLFGQGRRTPSPYELAAGDYNRDGMLTLADTLLILRHWVLKILSPDAASPSL